jgi:carboxyl-terminal processing protease
MTMFGWDEPSGMASGAGWLASLMVVSSAKSAAVLAAGAVVAMAMRRRSAAARHLAWSIAVVGALGVPALAVALPAWRIAPAIARLIPQWAGSRPVAEGPSPRPPLAAARIRTSTIPPDEVASIAPTPIERTASRPTPRPLPGMTAGPIPRAEGASSIGHHFRSMGTPSRLLAAWAAGAILSGIPVLLGILSLRRVARGAATATDPAMLELARRLAAQAGVRRPVRLILSPARVIPMTWGLFRPIILLPADAAGWTEGRLTTALLHELAHVRRWDCLTQLAARAACVAYWFNPLAWLALVRVRREQEHAADDFALERGLDPHGYAIHLLAIVTGRSLSWPRAAMATAMAVPSRLERRLHGILDDGRVRRGPARRAVALAASASAVLLLPLASFEPRSEARIAPYGIALPKQQPGGDAAKPGADGVSVASELLAKVRELSIKPPDESALRRGAVEGMLGALKDPYSTYFDAQQMADLGRNTTGRIVGIGVQISLTDGRVTVLAPMPDSPAARAGLRPGDFIDAIDGRPTAGISDVEAVRRIVGKEGEVVRIKVTHADGRAEELAITRGVVRIRSVRGYRLAGDREDFLLDLEHHVGYIGINSFTADTPAALAAALDDLKGRGVKGLILDLRACPGGLLNAATDAVRLFLAKGTIVTIRGRDQADRPIAADGPAAPAADLSLIVLADGTTASAAEIFAGALKDNGRAIVVGSRTFGKGSIQSIVKLKDDGGAVRLTTAYYQLPGGRDIDRRDGKADWGVDPTDGYYVPVDGPALDALTRRRLERGRIGGPAPAPGAAPGKVTPESIERDEHDPPLAAALRAMSAWTARGEFARTGLPLSEQAGRLERLEQARRRRRAILDDLKKVEAEIGELDGGAAGRP